MFPKNIEEFIPPVGPHMMDTVDGKQFSEVSNPDTFKYISKREELDLEMLERRRLLKEILALSSEIHSARTFDIDRRLDESMRNRIRHVITSFLSGNFNLIMSFDSEKLKDNITRNVMDQEVTVGSMIFKDSDAEGSHTVFVSHDRVDEVFWHFEFEQIDAKSVTTRYVIGEYDIRKTTDAQQPQIVGKQELLNLRNSVAMIHNILSRGLYEDSLRSEFDLAA